MADVFSALVASFFGAVFGLIRLVFFVLFLAVAAVLTFFFVRYHFNPLRLDVEGLKQPYIRYKYLDLFRWLLVDFLERDKHRGSSGSMALLFILAAKGPEKRSLWCVT